MEFSKEYLVDAYRQMCLIRAFEEKLHNVAQADNTFGFAHLYAGAEACAVGVCMDLESTPRDIVASTHRAHGHYIAKGGKIQAIASEIFGRADGSGGGKGGTMHVADWQAIQHIEFLFKLTLSVDGETMAADKLARRQRLPDILPETLSGNTNLLDAQCGEFEYHGGHIVDDDTIIDEPNRTDGTSPLV